MASFIDETNSFAFPQDDQGAALSKAPLLLVGG